MAVAAPPVKDEERRKAAGFPYWLDVQTRWSDNDQYGHINNAIYYHCADAAINAYLISHCGLRPYRQPSDPPPATEEEARMDVLGLMISTSATYYAPATFPCVLRVGLRVIKLGSSSVLFELGMFELPEPSGPASASASSSSSPSSPSSHSSHSSHSLSPPQPAPLSPSALACALTRATHVYVGRNDRRPVRPMPEPIAKGLAAVRAPEWADDDDQNKANAKAKI
ncbi:unnamed protein product [Parajaminaea phylloscopi]